jgi:hypothetical protein
MDTKSNQERIIEGLQEEREILLKLLDNQAIIIGLKETIIYQQKAKINELESQVSRQFWTLERSN